MAAGEQVATEVPPPPSPRRYWTRREVALWLVGILEEHLTTIIGIDHGFSFPMQYFDAYHLTYDWPAFLDDFNEHWPTDETNMYVCFVRDGAHGNGVARLGDPHWRRLNEIRARARSVFQFEGPGTVAYSTHAGLPWLRFIRHKIDDKVHFWPFDGWEVPTGRSAVVEVYPRLWSAGFPRAGRTANQHDAYAVAEWLRRADACGDIGQYFHPELSVPQQPQASIEGWILGVM